MKVFTTLASFLAVAQLLVLPLHSQSVLYWDLNGNVAGSGGGSSPAGVWNSTSANWNPQADGTGAPSTWTAGQIAAFAAGANATGAYQVILAGTQTAAGVTLEEGTLTLAGGSLSAGASSLAVQVATGTRLNLNSVLAGTVTAGSNGMAISSGGTVRLMAATNTFSGDISVNASRLEFITATTDLLSLGAGTKSVTLTNGAVVAPVNSANPSSTSGKSFVIGTGGGAFNVVNGVTLTLDDAGQFSGTGNLTITGSGTGLVVLGNTSVAHTFSGSVNVQSGTLRVQNAGALGAVAAGKTIAVADGASLDIRAALNANPITVQGSGVNNNGALTNSTTTAGSSASAITLAGHTSMGVTNTAALTISGVISGNGMNLTKVGAGSGSLILTGLNTYTGNTIVNAGTLVASAATNAAPINSSSGLVLSGTGTFQYLGRSAATVNMVLNGLEVAGGAATVDVNNTGTSTTLDLRGTGATLGITRTQRGGTVDFKATTGILGTNAIVLTNQANDASGILGAWATVNGGASFAMNDGTGKVVALTSFMDIAALGGTIANSANSNVRINSAGSGANMALAPGTTSINTLIQNTTTAVTVDVAGKTLRFGAAGGVLMTPTASTTGAMVIGAAANAGTVTAGGADNAAGELILSNFSGSALTVNSVIADNGTGVVSVNRSGTGAGLVTLAGTNTYTGSTTLSSGTTNVAVLANVNTASSLGKGSLAGSAADLVLNGGALQYTGATAASTDRLFSLGLGGGALDSSSATAAAVVTFNGTGAMGFNGQSGARNLTLTGTNTGANILAAVIGDNGGATTLTKNGAGLWVLTGDSTYSGLTTITAGTLRVGNGGTTGSLGSGAVNLVGTLIFNRSDNYTVNNAIFGSSGSVITQASANVLTLAAAGINTGGLRITVDGGTIDIAGNDVILTGSSSLTTSNSGTINATGGGRILLGVGNGDYGAASGKTLVINAAIADGIATTIDFHGGTNSSGVTILTADSIFTGTASIQGQAVSVSKIGNAGTAGNLGLNSVINLGSGATTTSRLIYTGTGETTDRTINLSATTGVAIIDQSGTGLLDFTSAITAAAGVKALTLQGSTAGSGRISGAISNGTDPVGVTKAGTGTWTLAGNNTYSGPTTVNGGVLLAGSTSAFGNGSAMNVGAAGTVRLDGFNNSLGSLAGTGNVENANATTVTLTLGTDGTSTVFGGILRDGAGGGALSLVKTGTGIQTLSGADISYTGSTTVAGGTLNLAGSQGSALATSSITVAGGGTLNLNNQTGQLQTFSSGILSFGAGTGTAGLGLELGASTAVSDRFVSSGSIVTANNIAFNIFALTGFGQALSYDLLSAGSGLSGATYSLGSVAGGYTYNLVVSDTKVSLQLTAMAAGDLYWRGGVNNSWSGYNAGITNWTTDAAGTINAGGNPGANHSVIFSSSAATGPAITTTLDGNYFIRDLTFTAAPTGVTSVTIAPGLNSSNALTLTPTTDATGIQVQDNAGNVTISAPVVLGGDQTWNVAGTGANGSSLTVSGGVSGAGNLTKSGDGTLTFGGVSSHTGATTISGGTVVAGVASAFSASSAYTVNSPAVVRLNGFANAMGSLAGSGIVENNHASTAAVLTVGGNNLSTVFSGTLRNNSGAGTGTLALVKTGTGTLTLTGANTFTGTATVSAGALTVGNGTSGSITTTSNVIVGNTAGNAVLNLVAGGSISSPLLVVGNANGASGAVNISGGTYTATTAETQDTIPAFGAANGGYGSLVMTGGTLNLARFQFGGVQGANTTGGIGVGLITGGTVNNTGFLLLARHGASIGVLTVAGGTLNHNAAGQNIALGWQGTGRAELNITGGMLDNTGRSVQFGGGTWTGTGIVNMNAGTLVTNSFTRTSGTSYINFNGGTLRAGAASPTFIQTTVNRVTVNGAFGTFAGGAVVDTNSFDLTIGANLLAPTGNGVATIQVVDGGSGYIGAPAVTIGGLGAGATAIANMVDDGTGNGTLKVASITITNPGVDYTGTPSVGLSGGGAATVATLGTVTLAANTSGGLTKTGAGVLTLSGTNTFSGAVGVTDGALAFAASENLGDASATNTLGLSNGAVLRYTGAGLVDLGVNRGLSLGTGGGVVDVNTATGLLTLGGDVSGAGAALTKTGTGTLVIIGAASHTGATVASGGGLTISGALSGTNALNVSSGATLNLSGSMLTPGAIQTVSVAGGGYLNLANGAGVPLSNVTTLNLGAGSGTARLGLDLGTTSDLMTTAGAAVTANAIRFELTKVAGFGVGTYNLLSAGSGLGGASYSAHLTGYAYSLTSSSTLVQLNVLSALVGDVYWRGDLGNSWASYSPGSTNWATNAAGTTDAAALPGVANGVIFSSSATTGPAISTTLDGDFAIASLRFTNAPAGVTSVTIAQGASGTLTLAPSLSTNGLIVDDNAGTITIAAPVAVGTDQTWNISATGASLTISGAMSGNGMLTKTGAGTMTISGVNTHSGATEVSTGVLQSGSSTGLSASSAYAVNGTAILRLNGNNSSVGSLAGSGFVENNHISAASILTIGSLNSTTSFSGVVRNGAAGTMGLTKVGTGTLTLGGVNTYTGATLITGGTLQLGIGGNLTGGSALTITAAAGVTAAFDVNGGSPTLASITLGGASGSSAANILDTAGGGVISLGGTLTYSATNNPLGSIINAGLLYAAPGGSRTITAAASTGATVELVLNGTITGTGFTTDNRVVFSGTGDITINNLVSVTGSGSDLQKNSTGILNINAATSATDDWVIDAGILNANVSNALNAADDIVIDGAGTQDSAIVNIGGTAGGSGFHQGDDLFIRNGGRVNVLVNNGISTGTDMILVGDASSASAAAAGRLDLAADISIGANGLQLGNGTNIGNVTGTGIITTAGTFSLRNGAVESGITLAGTGAITKVSNSTVVFSGSRTTTGATNIQEGTLILDYTTNNTSKIGGVLTLGAANPALANPVLTITGSATAATNQSVASTTLLLGATKVNVNAGAGQSANLNLAAITRSVGGSTVAFAYNNGSASVTTAHLNAILPYATLTTGGTTRLAATDGTGNVVQMTGVNKNDVTTWIAADNVSNTGAFSGVLGTQSVAASTLSFVAGGTAATVNVDAASRFTLRNGGIYVDSGVGANGTVISGGQLAGATSGVTGEIIVHQHNSLATLTIGSRLFGTTTLTKSGAGALVLSGNNYFATSINNGAASFVALNEGTLVLKGGNAIGDATSVHMKAGTTLELEAGASETLGRLGIDTSNPSNGTIALGAGSSLTINQTGSATYSGVFSGSGTITKVGNGNLQLTGNTAAGFTGVLNVNAGMLYISGSAGRLNGSVEINLNAGSSFLIDNDDDSSNTTRISDAAVITLNSVNSPWAGETRARGLSVRTDNNSNMTESVGSLVFASGANYAGLEAAGGSNSVAGIIAANGISRSVGATFNIRGAALGATSGQRSLLKIADANDTAFMTANLVGGGAATGASNKNVSIVPWAIGETILDDLADNNMGNSFVTYVDNRGFVVLDLATEFRTFAAGGSTQDNIRESLSANLTGVSGQTINSLILHDATTAAGSLTVSGSGVLTNTSGAFLFTLNTAATASSAHGLLVSGFSGIQVGATNEYIMQVVNPVSTATTPALTVEIASNLTSNGASLVKSGRGTLILSGANTYGGGTFLNEGVLQVASLANLGSGGLTFNGGVLRFGGVFADDLSSRAINVSNAGGTLDTNGTSYVWLNGLDMTGAGNFVKSGSGLLTIQGASTFTGTFVVGHTSVITGGNAGVTQGVLLNGATNQTILGNLQIGSSGTPAGGIAGAALGADEQIADSSTITFNGVAASSRWAYFKLLGHTETVVGISDVTGAGVIENRETDTVGSSGALILNSDRDFSYNGYLRDNNVGGADANPLSLTKLGTGMQILSGSQIRYTGGTTVNGGTLYLLNTSSFASSIVNNALVVFDYTSGTALNLGKDLSGSGKFVKRGTGTVALNGANTFSGALVIEEGSVSFSNSLGNNAVGNTISILENSTLISTGAASVLGNNQHITLGGETANIEVTGGSNVLTVAGSISGGAQTRFDKEGAGTLVLAGASTYAGATQVNAGRLEVRHDSGLGSTTSITVANGASLVFNSASTGSGASYGLAGSGSVVTLGTSGGTVSLGFGINGASNDRLVLGAGQSLNVAATTVSTDIYVSGSPLLTSYTLVQSASATSYSAFSLGAIFNPGSYVYTLDNTQANNLVLNVTALAGPATAYWKGDLTGSGTGVWNASQINGNTNWATAADGLVDTQVVPDAGTDVFFNAAGAQNFTTTLGADIAVKSVTFLAGSGSGGSNTLVTGGNTLTLGLGGFSLLTGSGNISFSPNVALAGTQTWTVADSTAVFTVSGSVSGTGDVIKTGAGVVVLSGANTYTGKTVVNAGSIQVSAEAGLGGNPTGGFQADQLTLNGGTLIATANMLIDDANRGITLGATGGTFSVNSGVTLTVANAIAGGGTFTKSGAGTMVANGANNFNGAVVVNAGTLTFGNQLALASGTVTAGTMNLGGAVNSFSGTVQVGTLATGALNYAVVGGSLSIGSGASSNLDIGVINDASTTARKGTVDLRGSASFTANVGMVRLGVYVSGGNVGLEGDLFLATNNTITASTSFVVASSSTPGVAGVNTVAFGSGTNTVNTPVMTIGGFKGSGEATLASGGTLTLQGLSGGSTMLNIGRNLGNTGTLTSSTFDMSAGTLIANLGAVVVGEKTGGGLGTATAVMTLGTSSSNSVVAASLVVGSFTSGTGSTTASFGSGTLNMGGGTFEVTGDVTLAGHNNGTGLSSGTLNLTGGIFTIGGNVFKGISASATATVTLNGGTLDMTGGTIGSSATNGQVIFQAQQGRIRNLQELNGGGAFVKTTAGTLIASGVNGYTGATSVQAGVFQVGENQAGSISSAVTVLASGTLAGTGTINNQVEIQNDAFLKPGDLAGAGKGRISMGSLTVATGGQIQLQLTSATIPLDSALYGAITGGSWVDAQTYYTANNPVWNVPASPLTSHDAVAMTGTLTLGTRESGTYGNGTILLINDGYVARTGDVFNLLDWVGLVQGGFSVTSGQFAGLTSAGDLDLPELTVGFYWDTSAFMTQGILVVVPEPSRGVMLLLAAALVTLRRRRRLA